MRGKKKKKKDDDRRRGTERDKKEKEPTPDLQTRLGETEQRGLGICDSTN